LNPDYSEFDDAATEQCGMLSARIFEESSENADGGLDNMPSVLGDMRILPEDRKIVEERGKHYSSYSGHSGRIMEESKSAGEQQLTEKNHSLRADAKID
jgi:hypothetical protein